MNNKWFTADTHYMHKNMTYGCSAWSDKENSTRKFKTVEQMSQHIVEQINKYVGEDDELYHFGDWSFGGIERIWEFRRLIRCKTIYLIFGNHDTHIRNNIILPNCYSNDDDIITNGPNPNRYKDDRDELFDVYAQDLFEECFDYIEFKVDKKDVCGMHYPIESWNRRYIHLHGHTHARLPKKEDRLDVGMDNAFKLLKEYRPFNWEDIKKFK